MKTFIFTVSLIGTGENEDQAWNDATESFSLDPGPTPKQHDKSLKNSTEFVREVARYEL